MHWTRRAAWVGGLAMALAVAAVPLPSRATVAPFILVVLDGEDNAATGHIDGVANIQETAGGTALKVRADLDPAMGPDPVSFSVVATDHNGATAGAGPITISTASSPDQRTLSLDVHTLADGRLDLVGTITDGVATETATAVTTLDLHAPQTTWGTTDGAVFLTVRIPVVGPLVTTVDLSGTSRDVPAITGIQFVYVSGVNLDTGRRFGRTARLTAPEMAETSWELSVPLEPGTWRLTAQAQDTAGNFEAPGPAVQVTVYGL